MTYSPETVKALRGAAKGMALMDDLLKSPQPDPGRVFRLARATAQALQEAWPEIVMGYALSDSLQHDILQGHH